MHLLSRRPYHHSAKGQAPCRYALPTLPPFAGCQYFPHSEHLTAPENELNPAWIRIVNSTQYAELYQYENGKRWAASFAVVRFRPFARRRFGPGRRHLAACLVRTGNHQWGCIGAMGHQGRPNDWSCAWNNEYRQEAATLATELMAMLCDADDF
jgi:hypothetical protein